MPTTRLVRYISLSLIICAVSLSQASLAESIARNILVFYDAQAEHETTNLQVHQMAEMSLNHLGLVVKYHDINKPLPDQQTIDQARGVLIWFEVDSIPNASHFIDWIAKFANQEKSVVVMSTSGLFTDRADGELNILLQNKFWATLGLINNQSWTDRTFKSSLQFDSDILNFERQLPASLPGYAAISLLPKSIDNAHSHLSSNNLENKSTLIYSSHKGGYIADGYAFLSQDKPQLRKWYVNPFKFFQQTFVTHNLPKADTTTLVGRRIYYSHIDGDGWRNLTLMPPYRKQGIYSSEVLLKEVFERYPELPVSVGPVTADIDLTWMGNLKTLSIARDIFALPNTEAASHTHSHPLQWNYFEKPVDGMEDAYLDLYPKKSAKNTKSILDLFRTKEKNLPPPPDSAAAYQLGKKQQLSGSKKLKELHANYSRPRAYYTGPYNTDIEIQGSFNLIEKHLPDDEKVKVLLWSGDTQPYEQALKATRDAGVRNLNGGDTRFDRQYDSYAWVTPIGRTIGNEQQIYSSNSNENTYTNLWTGPFYGFKHLIQTFQRTETPIRVKPLNVYYHMYSGERLGAVNALHDIFEYVKTQKIVPITASQFAAMGDGFFSLKLHRLAQNQWQVKQRDNIQTIRFDNAIFKTADLSRSSGVLGMKHHQGSLYIHLDPAVKKPVVATKTTAITHAPSPALRPYLIDSHWSVSHLIINQNAFSFSVQGFGPGDMNWWVPKNGEFSIEVTTASGEILSKKARSHNHQLNISLSSSPYKSTKIDVSYIGEGI